MNAIVLPKSKTWSIDIFFLMLVLGSLFFLFLGVRPLSVPDEANYSEIVREMWVNGDYITSYLNEIKFFEKPVLLYWLGTIAVKIGGLNLWSIRSVNAVLALLGCLMTYGVGRKIYNRQTGLFAAFILGTSTLYFGLAHFLTTDMTVSTFCTATLFAFILGQKTTGKARRQYFWLAAVAAGLAVLTKGLLGLVLPLMIIGAWIVLLSEWRILKQAYLLSSLFIFLLVAAPWHILVSLKNPEFFQYYFVNQHLLRYFTPLVGHPHPAWYYIPILLVGFFPWIAFLPQTIKSALPSSWRNRASHQYELFFLLWAVLVYAFFTVAKTKLPSYILPMFAPLAILTAKYLTEQFRHQASLGIKLSYAMLILVAVAVGAVFILFTHYWTVNEIASTNVCLAIAACVLFSGLIISYLYLNKSISKAIIATIVTIYLYLLMLIVVIPYIDILSIRPLTNRLIPILKPQDEVVSFNHHFQDLSFYIERRIYILNSRKLFKFGMRHQGASDWMIDDAQFTQLWNGSNRVFAIMHKSEYQQTQFKYPDIHFYVWEQTSRNILVSNQPIG